MVSLVLPGTCITPYGLPKERGKGNMSSSSETFLPLGLKGLPRNLLNLENIG